MLKRTIDICLQICGTVLAIGLLFLPDTVAWKLTCGMFLALGLWSVIVPSGIIGWAKTSHRGLDPSDSSVWWVPRTVGAFFIFFALLLALITTR